MVRQTGPTAGAWHLFLAAVFAFVGVGELMRYPRHDGAARIAWVVVAVVLLAVSAFLVRVAIWAFRNDGKV
jgi:hypothetical protein